MLRLRILSRSQTLPGSGLGLDTKALIAAIAALAVLASYRFYSYWTTGFFVSDEFGYYFYALHNLIYTDRWFFSGLNIYVFDIFGIRGVDAFSYFLPFYIVFWTGSTFVVFYKLLKVLGFDQKTIALSVVSSFVLISFVLLSLGFLTEPMGLCLAMLGVYFLARFFKSTVASKRVLFSFAAAFAFGLAAGTREPYNAFVIGGIAIVAVLAVVTRDSVIPSGRIGRMSAGVLSVAIFAATSAFFLFVPTHAYSQQVAPITTQLAQSLFANPLTVGGNGVGHVGNSTSGPAPPTFPFYTRYVLTNTLLIFFGGILLGWGPICFAVGALGLFVLFRLTIRSKTPDNLFLLLTALAALGSYLIVSFIFAPDPSYFSFTNYSTIIRFSDTALPAYFITAPIVMSRVAKSRRRAFSVLGIFVAFLVISVPVYEVYATSNLGLQGTTQNPFQPGYRTDAAILRDYFDMSLKDGQAVDLLGVPYGWPFTPGLQDLSVSGYAIGVNPFVQQMTLANFTAARWTSFDLFVMNTQTFSDTASLAKLLNSSVTLGAIQALPFSMTGSQVALKGGDFTLYQVQLIWG